MRRLLDLQELDLKIEVLLDREKEIPKQKEKFNIHQKRLADELKASDDRCKSLILEQRECEGDIDQKLEDIKRKDGQLLAVRKNDEYQALLHEMDMLKKQIAIKEERILTLMIETDEAKARFEEDKKRIAHEQKKIEEECGKIDQELRAAIQDREIIEQERGPVSEDVPKDIMARYRRIRKSKKRGAAAVPLHGEACSGCHMLVTAQVYNEILAGDKFHACSQCGRLLYSEENFKSEPAQATETGN